MSRTAESPDRRPRRRRNTHARGPVRLGHAARNTRTTAEPSRIEIHAAVPKGSRRARNQPEALRALEARIALEADLGRLRSDAERNALAMARAVVFSSIWQTRVTRPGWDTLMDRTGLKRTSVAKYLRLFNEWGLLGRVRTGSTWKTRGGREEDQDGNFAGEYVLCVPAQEPVEETRTPSLGSRREPEKPHVRAREEAASEVAERPWLMHQPTKTRQDRLQAAKRLQTEALMLRRITPQLLRHVLRPQLTNGWTVADILHALNHEPDGTPHWHTADVRHVAAWIRHRLKAWAGHQPPKPVGARQTTMLEAADVAALPRPGGEPTADVETHATLARRLLAATTRRSDKKPVRGLGVLLPGRDGNLQAPVELEPPASRNPYAADDPRRRYAEKADLDRAKDFATMAEAAEQHRQPAGMGSGFDWLERSLRRRSVPGAGRAIA